MRDENKVKTHCGSGRMLSSTIVELVYTHPSVEQIQNYVEKVRQLYSPEEKEVTSKGRDCIEA